MYYDEYYESYSEFDKQVDEFKQALIQTVKKEHQDEIERLRAENAMLSDIRDKWEKVKSERKQEKQKLETAILAAEREAKKARLLDLLKPLYQGAWKVKQTDEKTPKCDRCNENRKIEYTTPLGNKRTESCDCDKLKNEYIPVEVFVVCFEEDDRGWDKGKINYYLAEVNYHGNKSWDKSDNSWCHYTYVYEGQPFEKLSMWNAVFIKKSDAEKYCKWLQKKREEA